MCPHYSQLFSSKCLIISIAISPLNYKFFKNMLLKVSKYMRIWGPFCIPSFCLCDVFWLIFLTPISQFTDPYFSCTHWTFNSSIEYLTPLSLSFISGSYCMLFIVSVFCFLVSISPVFFNHFKHILYIFFQIVISSPVSGIHILLLVSFPLSGS